jgi:hypothetical protein
MAQKEIVKAPSRISKTLKFVFRAFGIGFALYLFVMVLASTLQIIIGMDYVTIEFRKFSHIQCIGDEPMWKCAYYYFIGKREAIWIVTTYEVDVATWIIVGAIDLILTVLHTILILIGMIIVWLANAFIFGEDSQGKLLNPISLVQLLRLIPFLGDVFRGVHGIDESIIGSLDALLTAFDNLFYEIANGFFSGISGIYENIAREVLGKRKVN